MQIYFLKLRLNKIKKSSIKNKRRFKKSKKNIILLFLGILVFFYPLISKFLYQKNLSYTIDNYVETIDKMETTKINKQKEDYEKYNKMLLNENTAKIDLLKRGEI